jgi:hypothetical protein
MAVYPQLEMIVQRNFPKIYDAYIEGVPEAQTRVAWRKGKQVHTGANGLRTRVSRRLGAKMGKAVRLGAPKKITLDPMITQYDKAYHKDPRTGQKTWVLDVFEASRTIRPRNMLIQPTDAAARRAGERWRRNVTTDMFRGQLIFLSRGSRVRGRGRPRSTGRTGVLVHKDDPGTILFYVTGPVRLKRLFQPRASVFERQTHNTDALLAKELERQLIKRLKRI